MHLSKAYNFIAASFNLVFYTEELFTLKERNNILKLYSCSLFECSDHNFTEPGNGDTAHFCVDFSLSAWSIVYVTECKLNAIYATQFPKEIDLPEYLLKTLKNKVTVQTISIYVLKWQDLCHHVYCRTYGPEYSKYFLVNIPKVWL